MTASSKTASLDSMSEIGQSPPSTAMRTCIYIVLVAIPTASLAWTAGLLLQINSGVSPISIAGSASKNALAPPSVTGSIAGDTALLTGMLWAWIAITGAQILLACIVGMLEIACERTQASMRFRTFEITSSVAMMLSAIFVRVAIPQSIISPGQFFAFQLCKEAGMVAVSLVWQFTLPGGQIANHLIRRENRRLVSRPQNPVPTPCVDPTSLPKSAKVEPANVAVFSFASITQPKRHHGTQARQVLIPPPRTTSHVPSLPRLGAPLAQPPVPAAPVGLQPTHNHAAQMRTDAMEHFTGPDLARLDISILTYAGADDSALVTSFNSLPRTAVKFAGTDEAVDAGCHHDRCENGRIKLSPGHGINQVCVV